MPALIAVLQHGTATEQETARDELIRLAGIADQINRTAQELADIAAQLNKSTPRLPRNVIVVR